jgi:micrococcal nuclease
MKKNPFRIVLSWVALLLTASIAYWNSLEPLQKSPNFLKNIFSSEVVVRKIIDGDTIELNNGQRVRYIGIDCPESKRKTSSGWVDVGDPYSKESVRMNEELVSGKKVRLEFDVQKKDKYNRLLAYCFVKVRGQDVLVQAQMLKEGLAYLYTAPPNIKYIDALVAALNEAKQNRRGVWSKDLTVLSNEAVQFLGQRKLIEGQIKRVRKNDRVIRLMMEGLEIIIFKKDLELFTREGIDPAEFYDQKKVRVFGLIKEYKGKTEIILSNPWQIEIF